MKQISALEKIDKTKKDLGYMTVFAVNNVTKNYYQEGYKLLDVMSESDPDDSWFLI